MVRLGEPGIPLEQIRRNDTSAARRSLAARPRFYQDERDPQAKMKNEQQVCSGRCGTTAANGCMNYRFALAEASERADTTKALLSACAKRMAMLNVTSYSPWY